MNRQEIEQEIEALKRQIFMEEMKDAGYDSSYVDRRQKRIAELREMLKRLEGG